MVANVTSRAFIRKSEEFLFIHNTRQQDSTYYVLPGGHIDHGETRIQAVVREIKEELALDFTEEQAIYLGQYEQKFPKNGKTYFDTSFIFLFDWVGPKEAAKQQERNLIPIWLKLTEFDTKTFYPRKLLDLVEDWIAKPNRYFKDY